MDDNDVADHNFPNESLRKKLEMSLEKCEQVWLEEQEKAQDNKTLYNILKDCIAGFHDDLLFEDPSLKNACRAAFQIALSKMKPIAIPTEMQWFMPFMKHVNVTYWKDEGGDEKIVKDAYKLITSAIKKSISRPTL